MQKITKDFLYTIFLILMLNVLAACASGRSRQNNNTDSINTGNNSTDINDM